MHSNVVLPDVGAPFEYPLIPSGSVIMANCTPDRETWRAGSTGEGARLLKAGVTKSIYTQFIPVDNRTF